ncbi:MAG: enoyl-ACP reductase, partial [Gammaproteobacteria bacterium]
VASNRSIAWGIAKAMHREGAELAFTYQNDKLRDRVEKFASEVNSEITVPCDVASDEQIQGVFEQIDDYWDSLDILVHSVAYAPRDQLEGEYLESLTREGFLTAHEISSYSFSALGDAARPLMKGRNGAMLTLSYIGAVRAMPNYNVMGVAKASLEANVRYMAASLGPENIRVNAISAGPIRTLAASGISGLKDFLAQVEKNAPLRRNVTIDEVGNVAAFLCSDYASAITGEITYVDCGYNAIGMT